MLCDLGKGWTEPFDKIREYRPRCLEPNVAVGVTLEPANLSDDAIEEQVRQTAADIDMSFGNRECRAFGHPKADPDQSLDLSKFHTY